MTVAPRAMAQWLAAAIATVACEAVSTQRQPSSFDTARKHMVDEQLAGRDIKDPRVLDAMRKVPRHEFVPAEWRGGSYDDSPLPIGHGQTISQPYIVAYMSEALELDPSHRVLEIGTGSGYQAAILGLLAKEVYTIEIVEPLAAARARNAETARAHECARALRQWLSWMAGGSAVRSRDGDGGAGCRAPGPRRCS